MFFVHARCSLNHLLVLKYALAIVIQQKYMVSANHEVQ